MFGQPRFCLNSEFLINDIVGRRACLERFEGGFLDRQHEHVPEISKQVFYEGAVEKVEAYTHEDRWQKSEHIKVQLHWTKRRVEQSRWVTWDKQEEFSFLRDNKFELANIYPDGRTELGIGFGEILIIYSV